MHVSHCHNLCRCEAHIAVFFCFWLTYAELCLFAIRYDANKGLLTLVSEKYSMREENRRHIMEMLAQLVSEGHQAFPVPDTQQQQAA